MTQDNNKLDTSAQQEAFENEMIEIDKLTSDGKKTYTTDEVKYTKKKQKRRIFIGAVFTILAFMGVLSIFSGAFNVGKNFFDNTAEKQKYNALLNTLVMYDPLPFESPEEADQRVLLASSAWAAIMNEDIELYEKNEYSETYLPAVDVDKYYAKIFGTKTKLTHGTFSDQDIEFVYDEEKQAYIIPTTSFPTGFTPQVEKIKTTLKEKIVTIGYLSPQSSIIDNSERTVSKYVDYIFEKQDGNFYLTAIRESSKKVEVASSSEAKQ